MTLTVHHIRGNPQTGKTTMALGFLEKLHAAGHPVLYVAPTLDRARDRQRYTPVPCIGAVFVGPNTVNGCTAIAVDDCDYVSDQGRGLIEWAALYLGARPGPTQLVLVNWRGEFPPKVPQCASCGTTENLRRDVGSGGPWRCTSPDCVVF